MLRRAQSQDAGPHFTCAQASRSLGLTAAALSARLRAKRIEPSREGTYSLRQLVDAMTEGETPNERNAMARAELAAEKARQVRLEIAERENKFIRRDEVLGYLRGLLSNLYRAIDQAGLAEEVARGLENEIFATATAFWLDRGWELEPDFDFSSSGNGTEPLSTRAQKWASMMCGLFYETVTQRAETELDEPVQPSRGIQSGRGRNRHPWAKRR
jgi:hypothetical protein